MERRLGTKNAQKVLKAFEENERQFGFIKISEEELADLRSLYTPSGMAVYRNVFSFRAGIWVVMIVDEKDYISVHLINAHDPDEVYTTMI